MSKRELVREWDHSFVTTPYFHQKKFIFAKFLENFDKIFRPEHTVHIYHVIPDRHRLKQVPGLSVNKKLPGMGIHVEAKKTSLNRRFIDELVVHKNIVTDTFNWTFYLGKDDPKKLVIGSYKRQALTDEDINEMSMDTMPGFHVRWAYSPNETELHPIWRP